MARFPLGKKRKHDGRDLDAVIGDYELAPFPALISQALERIGQPEFDLNGVADLMAADPAVTVRLLGLVNSAALSRGRVITSVHQAAVIVGRNQLESLLISLAVKSALPSPTVPGFDRRRFWTTAARRAAIAGRLSMVVDPRRQSENFTAALLQDMALPVLAERATGYSDTLLDWHESPVDLAGLERRTYGWDHGQISSLMAARWNFPLELIDFMDGHHAARAATDGDGLVPARVVAPIRESDEAGDEHVVQLASDLFSLPADQVVDLVTESDADAARLATMFV
ncbi:MAG: HDOD domain-containing protein [Acidimicrobiia bacterium]|nr:HDOD domain-containing protein [Acidimicrobiia bacterium]